MRLTAAEFGELFESFRESAFRLETFQVYKVPEEADDLRAFREGRPMAERSMRTSRWLQNIARTTAQGKRWTRVHLVQQPPTDYLEFELVGQEANVAAGEDVRIVVLNDHPDLAHLREDFWALDLDTDAAVIVWVRYDDEGHLLAFERSTDPNDLAQCRHQRDLVLSRSIPLYLYRARTAASTVA